MFNSKLLVITRGKLLRIHHHFPLWKWGSTTFSDTPTYSCLVIKQEWNCSLGNSSMNFREFSRTASLITRGGYPPQETEETIVSDYMGSLHFGGRYLVFKAFHIEGIGLFSSSWILEDGFNQKPRTFDKDFFVTRFSCWLGWWEHFQEPPAF